MTKLSFWYTKSSVSCSFNFPLRESTLPGSLFQWSIYCMEFWLFQCFWLVISAHFVYHQFIALWRLMVFRLISPNVQLNSSVLELTSITLVYSIIVHPETPTWIYYWHYWTWTYKAWAELLAIKTGNQRRTSLFFLTFETKCIAKLADYRDP